MDIMAHREKNSEGNSGQHCRYVRRVRRKAFPRQAPIRIAFCNEGIFQAMSKQVCHSAVKLWPSAGLNAAGSLGSATPASFVWAGPAGLIRTVINNLRKFLKVFLPPG